MQDALEADNKDVNLAKCAKRRLLQPCACLLIPASRLPTPFPPWQNRRMFVHESAPHTKGEEENKRKEKKVPTCAVGFSMRSATAEHADARSPRDPTASIR